MMRKLKIISLFLVLLFIFQIPPEVSVSAEEFSTEPPAEDAAAEEDFRGLWVATVVNIDYPSQATADSEILKAEALKILDHAEVMGMNAVFLQVRPTADALYNSKYFPVSKYLTGVQGQAPSNAFDPLEFWITEAHSRGIELHAWINPYRITKKTAKEAKHDFASLVANHPARINPSWVVQYTDGNLYFDPGIPEVRNLVIAGAVEIIENYDIDGIHFDDYFYPGKDFDDKASFAKYGAGFTDLGSWRRENVNILIRDLSKAIKEKSSEVRFGISPVGIWANSNSDPRGSETKGLQSCYDQYADTRTWVKEEWIDYIAPQIYWNIGFEIADYSKLLKWWSETADGTNVDLYIGHAAYRTGNTDPASPWYGVEEIDRQLRLNEGNPIVKGSIFYNYTAFAKSQALTAAVTAIYQQRDGLKPKAELTIARPSGNIKTVYSQYYLTGASDPEKPLYMNGQPVEGRSSQGYYGILVALTEGLNTFSFQQEGAYVSRIINRETTAAPKKMSGVEIPAATVFPQSQELRQAGEKITLTCQAPIGSAVTVKLGGQTYTMKTASTAPNSSDMYLGTYSYVHTIPSYTGTPRNIDLGAPVYTIEYKGTTKARTAPATVGVIMKDSPYFAEVVKAVIDTYQTPVPANGASFELYKGMKDYVTGMTGSYVRLANGQWVNKGGVNIYASKGQLKAVVQNPQYATGDKWDTLKLELTQPVAATIAFDGKALALSISAAEGQQLPILTEGSLISEVTATKNENGLQYNLILKENQSIDGYYIEKTTTGIALHIKRPAKAAEGEAPLKGLTIMLDPGHGGSDTGATGPLGAAYAEKAINLSTSLKLQKELEALGAAVIMTRTTDTELSLEARLAASRAARPDLFVSMHANSMPDNVDISKVDGFSVFFRDKHAHGISEAILQGTLNTLGRNSKGLHVKNFYVIRGTWTPSVLIESGFVPNPQEFEWLKDDNQQLSLAKSISQAIVGYFKERDQAPAIL